MVNIMFYLIVSFNGVVFHYRTGKMLLKKITIKDGFDIKSVLEASDEVLALAGEKRYGNVMSIDKHEGNYLEIHQEF